MRSSLRQQGQGSAQAVVAAASALVLLAVAFAAPSVRRGETDFLSFYAGAKLVGTPYLYSVLHVHEVQKADARPYELRAYTRPPFYAAFLWPLGRFPYRIANVLWQTLNVVALGLFVLLNCPRRAFAAILCCWFLPVWFGFVLGQDIALLLLLVALAIRALLAGRDAAAGVIFSLCSVKFHLFLLLPVLILARKMWRFGIGFVGGAAVLVFASFLLAGPGWPAAYAELLLLNERGQASQGFMPNILGFFHSVPGLPIWYLACSFLVTMGVWRVVRYSSLEQALAAFLTGSLLVSPHSFYYDLSLLIPVVLLLWHPGRTTSTVAALMLVNIGIPLVGRFAVLPAVSWVARELYGGIRAPSVEPGIGSGPAGKGRGGLRGA